METEVQLMAEELRGKRIAALVENGFEQSELLEPKKALEQAGAKVDIVSPQTSQVKGWQHTDWGRTVSGRRPLDQARADDYDALLLPGGVMNPDKLRINPRGGATSSSASSTRASRSRRSVTARGR